jgi:transposase
MSRYELTDAQWAAIEPVLPKPHLTARRKRIDNRCIINGILYVLQTGCAWSNVPHHYCKPVMCWTKFRQWVETGVWDDVWRALLLYLDDEAKNDWITAFLKGHFVPNRSRGSLTDKYNHDDNDKPDSLVDGND